MLELMDKSKSVKRFLWSLIFTVLFVVFFWRLPDLITAIRWW